MLDQDAASLAAYHASLRMLADVQAQFKQSLAQAHAAERHAWALYAEAHAELQNQKRFDREASAAQEAVEHSSTP